MLGQTGMSCLTLQEPALSHHFRGIFPVPFSSGTNPMIPVENTDGVVEHVVLVHESVNEFSKRFLQKLRRSNYVTPKNYLDFINTYSKLLDEKTQYNTGKMGGMGWGTHRIQVLTSSFSKCFVSRS